MQEGSRLILDNCKVYYSTLQNLGGQITPVGCGAHAELEACSDYRDCADGNLCTQDSCSMTGDCQYTPVPLLVHADVVSPEAATIDVDDLICMLDGFAGNDSEACPLERLDIYPCGGAGGLIDLDDLLSLLDAFAGTPGCPQSCGG